MRRRVDVELDNEMAAVMADPADNPEVALQHKNNAEILRQGLAKLSPAHGLSARPYHDRRPWPPDGHQGANFGVLEPWNEGWCLMVFPPFQDCVAGGSANAVRS
jgi:hypothetical protein